MALFTKEQLQEIIDLAAAQKTEYRPEPLDTYNVPDDVANFQEIDYNNNN